MLLGKTIKEMQIGDSASFSKTISECDAYNFIGITGDINPIHIDEVYAGNTKFKRRIAHGMLTAGTIYLDQQLKFIAPVYFGDTITATVKVIDLIIEKNRVVLETICTNQNNKTVIVGKAIVMPAK